jgi:hypothetical protein
VSALRGALGALLVVAVCSSNASAQLQEVLIPPQRNFISPERFTLELDIGPYRPDLDDNDAFETYFSDDSGPLLGLELQIIGYRLRDIFYLTAGGGIGWAKYKGNTLDEAGERTNEETAFEIIPLNLLASARIDALARKLSVPFIFTGKLGYQWMRWSTSAGGQDDARGWSLGLLYGVQIALDLDFFEPAKARILDEEWGINHSYVLFDLMGFSPNSDSLPIGDFSWALGLGFIF